MLADVVKHVTSPSIVARSFVTRAHSRAAGASMRNGTSASADVAGQWSCLRAAAPSEYFNTGMTNVVIGSGES